MEPTEAADSGDKEAETEGHCQAAVESVPVSTVEIEEGHKVWLLPGLLPAGPHPQAAL
jgi:hypothetical protein